MQLVENAETTWTRVSVNGEGGYSGYLVAELEIQVCAGCTPALRGACGRWRAWIHGFRRVGEAGAEADDFAVDFVAHDKSGSTKCHRMR